MVCPVDDALQAAIDELYSADPDDFMQRRGALVGRRRSPAPPRRQTDRGPAQTDPFGLRLNMLARTDPDGIADLIDLGGNCGRPSARSTPKQIRELTGRAAGCRRADPAGFRRHLRRRAQLRGARRGGLDAHRGVGRPASLTRSPTARWSSPPAGRVSVRRVPELTVVPSPRNSFVAARAGTAEPEADLVELVIRTPRRRNPFEKRLSADEREEQRRLAADLEAEQKAQAKAAAEDAKRRSAGGRPQGRRTMPRRRSSWRPTRKKRGWSGSVC